MEENEQSRWRQGIATIVATSLFPVVCAGADIGAQVSAGYIKSDNIEETPIRTGSGVIEANGKFQLGLNTSTLDVNLDSDFRYRTFSNSRYKSDFLPNIRAGAVYTVSDNILYLTAQENLGQVALTSEQGLQPSDRQNVNVLTVGPDYFLGVTDQSRIHMSARYSLVNYEVSNQDGNRTRGEISYNRDLSNALTFAAGVFATRTTFQEDAIPSNDSKGLTFGLEGQSRRTQLKAVVGIQELTAQGNKSRGFYGELEFSRLLTLHSRLVVSGISRFGDTSDSFIFGQEFSSEFGAAVSIQVQPAPVRIQGGGLKYVFTGERLAASVGGSWIATKGVNDTSSDQSTNSAFFGFEYRISGPISAGIDGYRSHINVPAAPLGRQQNDSIGALVNWRVASKVSISFHADYFDRTQSSSNFHEIRYGAFVIVLLAKRKEADLFTHMRPTNRTLRDRTVY